MDRASAGRTTIVIAHKLATIRNADKIVVMSKGKIIEQGTHDSLISRDGAYARLVTTQQLTVSNEQTPEDSDIETLAKEIHSVGPSKSLTRHPTGDKDTDLPLVFDRYNDESFKQIGLFGIVCRLVVENPDLKWAYLALLTGCVISCE